MKKILSLALFISLAACTRLQVESDWDSGVDFTAFKSYELLQNDNDEVRPFAAQRIQDAIEAQMNARGLVKADAQAQADIAVGWELATEDRTTYHTVHSGFGTHGFRHSPTSWGVSTTSSRTTQQTYTVGTLLIAVFEMDNKQLVWEGTATGNINSSSARDEDKINRAVEGVLRDFPPSAE